MLRLHPLLRVIIVSILFIPLLYISYYIVGRGFILLFDSSGLAGLALALALQPIIQISAILLPILLSALLLKKLHIKNGAWIALLAGTTYYVVTTLYGSYYGTIPWILTISTSVVGFLVAYLTVSGMAIFSKFVAPAAAITAFTLAVITIPILATQLSNLSYQQEQSPENQERSNRKKVAFKPLIPQSLGSDSTVDATLRRAKGGLLADIENNTYVLVDVDTSNYSALIYESEWVDGFSKYVSPMKKCDLISLPVAIQNKSEYVRGDLEPVSDNIAKPVCRVAFKTASGDTVYGPLVPEYPTRETESTYISMDDSHYYYARIDNVIISIVYRPQDLTNGGKAELQKLIESLQPVDQRTVPFLN